MMNSLRYKTLLSYLPGMASVVNTFESPDVQKSVYETLMKALESKLQQEGLGAEPTPSSSRSARASASAIAATSGEVAHELVEGDSIHGDVGRSSIGSTTVF